MKDYQFAIASLHQAFSDEAPERVQSLTASVLRACAECESYLKQFPKGLDPAERWRREQNVGRATVAPLPRAVRTLSEFAREHTMQVSFALASAGYRGRDTETSYPIALAKSFADLLEEFEKQIRAAQWAQESFFHSTHYYNMIFPTVLKRRPPNLRPSTGLMLRLVMILRKFSAGGERFESFRTGEPIPNSGTPHYEIAAEFAQIATRDEIASPEKSLAKLLRSYPNLGLTSWPQVGNA